VRPRGGRDEAVPPRVPAPDPAAAPPAPALPLPTPALVMFDLDFTLLQPGDLFEAAGYRRTGARFGLELDEARWSQAELRAYAAVEERRALTGDAHDDGLLEVIARALIEGLGGGPADRVDAAVAAVRDAWSRAENFGLYDDVLPCLRALRDGGVLMALASNALGHELEEVVAHFALDEFIAASVSSADVGVVKPSCAVFEEVLARLGVPAPAAVMVGDSVGDDVEGALACGCGAILLDRRGRMAGAGVPRIGSLLELPAALSLPALAAS
jgi:putative hydrolase of the HAD superfamily